MLAERRARELERERDVATERAAAEADARTDAETELALARAATPGAEPAVNGDVGADADADAEQPTFLLLPFEDRPFGTPAPPADPKVRRLVTRLRNRLPARRGDDV
jgi:hypothetical protein